MALNDRACGNLKPYIKGKALSLGYPDLICTDKGLRQVFDTHDRETKSAFKKLGCFLKCVDFYKHKGVDEQVNLNDPVDLGKWDLVIDPGTIEHCFNVGQAFKNAAEAVKVGGVIFHIGSLSMVNHAFYSFSPTLFYDFYKSNGFEILLLEGSHKGGDFVKIHEVARIRVPAECVIHCIARKLEEKTIEWPIQWKYKKQWG